jgi:hypothetical protein
MQGGGLRASRSGGILPDVLATVSTSTWDLIGQIGVWFVGFPILVGGLSVYIYAQVVAEKRENDKIAGSWGLAAKTKNDAE